MYDITDTDLQDVLFSRLDNLMEITVEIEKSCIHHPNAEILLRLLGSIYRTMVFACRQVTH